MTIPELIEQVLASIARDFYDLDVHSTQPINSNDSQLSTSLRLYMRDRNALVKAISRYGYACDRRGWEFQVPHILKELMTLLISMREKKAEIHFLPKYLEGAIDRHIGQRAEELSALAHSQPRRQAHKLVDGLQRVVVVEKSPTETLADVYRALKKPKSGGRSRTIGRDPDQKVPAQKDLL
jgi:hypothetical protein